MVSAEASPTLVVVSGPPGSGKTTLAHELARAIPCPCISRDEIKEGMAHGADGFTPVPGDALTQRTLPLFFTVIRMLLDSGVTVVAEAAFQDHLWRPNLEPLLSLSDLVIVQCHAPGLSAPRIADRGLRAAHADKHAVAESEFRRIDMGTRSIDVDTSAGYKPPLAEIISFLNDGRKSD